MPPAGIFGPRGMGGPGGVIPGYFGSVQVGGALGGDVGLGFGNEGVGHFGAAFDGCLEPVENRGHGGFERRFFFGRGYMDFAARCLEIGLGLGFPCASASRKWPVARLQNRQARWSFVCRHDSQTRIVHPPECAHVAVAIEGDILYARSGEFHRQDVGDAVRSALNHAGLPRGAQIGHGIGVGEAPSVVASVCSR